MDKSKLYIERLLFQFNQSDESYEEMASENDKVIEDMIKEYEKYYDDITLYQLDKDDRLHYQILSDGLIHNIRLGYDNDCVELKRSLNLIKLCILMNFKYLKPMGVNNENNK